MALVHHIEYVDGRVEHVPFTRAGWESALKDPQVAGHWGHRPDECVDPVVAVRSRHDREYQAQPRAARVPTAVAVRELTIEELDKKLQVLKGKLLSDQMGLFDGGDGQP